MSSTVEFYNKNQDQTQERTAERHRDRGAQMPRGRNFSGTAYSVIPFPTTVLSTRQDVGWMMPLAGPSNYTVTIAIDRTPHNFKNISISRNQQSASIES